MQTFSAVLRHRPLRTLVLSLAFLALASAAHADPPTANDQSVSFNHDTSDDLIALTGSDPSNEPLTYTVRTPASHGSVSPANSNVVSYTPNQGYKGPDSFTFTVNDGTFDSAPATVSITVVPPTADNQPVSVNEYSANNPITLTGSDPASNPLSFLIQTPPIHGVLNGAAPNVTYTPTSGYFGADSFTFTVTAGHTISDPGTVSITVNHVNIPPTANAGSNFSVRVSSVGVKLHGSGTDPDGTIAGYSWTALSGAPALNNPTSPTPTFNSPASTGTLTYELIVTDNEGAHSNPSDVVVTVQPDNAPTAGATALPAQPIEGTVVTLQGSASDVDQDTLSFNWVQTSPQAPVTISNPTSLTATFTAPHVPVGGDVYTFRLDVSDGLITTSSSTSVNVQHLNHPPVSNPTTLHNTVNEGDTVQLFGSASTDPDNDPLTFAWTQVQDPHVNLSGANTSTATFTAPAVASGTVTLVFKLTVNDGQGGSDAKNISITVQHVVPSNHPPTVTIAPRQPVSAGTVVTLQANALDPDNDPLTYQWDQVNAPFATIIDSTNSTASFVAPNVSADTTYSFRVTVGDGRGGIATASISIVVLDAASAASGLPLIANPKTFPSPFSPVKGGATIRYTLRDACDVTILISDIFGQQVREFRQNGGSQGGTAGDNDVHWDGKNGEGVVVGNGAYVIQIRAIDATGAQGKVTDRVGVRR